MAELHEHLTEARKAAGLSQRRAAQRLRVSPSYMCRLEAGQQAPGQGLLDLMIELYQIEADPVYQAAGRIPSDVLDLLLCTPGAFDFVRGRLAYEGVGDVN